MERIFLMRSGKTKTKMEKDQQRQGQKRLRTKLSLTGHYEGVCDDNKNCNWNLICHQSTEGEAIPGCLVKDRGSKMSKTDFCLKPEDVAAWRASRPTSGPAKLQTETPTESPSKPTNKGKTTTTANNEDGGDSAQINFVGENYRTAFPKTSSIAVNETVRQTTIAQKVSFATRELI